MLIAEIDLFSIISTLTYTALAAAALWGLYCIVIVWTRVSHKRFKTEEAQDHFMDDVEQMLAQGDFDGVVDYCEGDARAVPQLVEMAVNHRDMGYQKARSFVLDRFQRDVTADLEYRLSWVNTVIKAAPMIGLFGTVFGMMGAFATLSTEGAEPKALAGDINVALRTTACGLAIAIPLLVIVSSVNIRIAKMEDLVGSGLARFMTVYRAALSKGSPNSSPASASMDPVGVQSPLR